MPTASFTTVQLDQIKSYDGILPPDVVAQSFGLQEWEVVDIWEGRWDAGREKIGPFDAILILGAKGRIKAKDLAEKYGVSSSTIFNIWAGDSHLDMPRTREDVYRNDSWKYRLMMLMIEEPRRPKDLAKAVKKSLNSVHREISKMRKAGCSIVEIPGEKANIRYYRIDNAVLTRPLELDPRRN